MVNPAFLLSRAREPLRTGTTLDALAVAGMVSWSTAVRLGGVPCFKKPLKRAGFPWDWELNRWKRVTWRTSTNKLATLILSDFRLAFPAIFFGVFSPFFSSASAERWNPSTETNICGASSRWCTKIPTLRSLGSSSFGEWDFSGRRIVKSYSSYGLDHFYLMKAHSLQQKNQQ